MKVRTFKKNVSRYMSPQHSASSNHTSAQHFLSLCGALAIEIMMMQQGEEIELAPRKLLRIERFFIDDASIDQADTTNLRIKAVISAADRKSTRLNSSH